VLTEVPGGRALVFCKTKRGADRVGEHLMGAGIRAAVIHGNKGQGARNRTLADFRNGRVSVLVATDIAARGLDIAHLPLVVNYDLPLVAEDYVHRVGRTGRAGVAGRAVSLVTGADRQLLHGIQQLLPAPIEHVAVTGFAPATTMTRDIMKVPVPSGPGTHGFPGVSSRSSAVVHDRHRRAHGRAAARVAGDRGRPSHPRRSADRLG
jgi:ATP-dependent RNA helicase RhlE